MFCLFTYSSTNIRQQSSLESLDFRFYRKLFNSDFPRYLHLINSFSFEHEILILQYNESVQRNPSPLSSFPKNQISYCINRNGECSIHASILAYTFYTPLTAASWKRIGYDTIAVFVGDFTKANVLTPRLNLSRNYLKHVGAHIVDIQCNESYSIKLSQLVRVFSGFLPDHIVQDEDNILTGDSDLIPLKASQYQPTSGTNGFIFNAFCCGSFQRRGRSYRMFPSKFYMRMINKEIISFVM